MSTTGETSSEGKRKLEDGTDVEEKVTKKRKIEHETESKEVNKQKTTTTTESSLCTCPPNSWGSTINENDETINPRGILKTIGDTKTPVYIVDPIKEEKETTTTTTTTKDETSSSSSETKEETKEKKKKNKKKGLIVFTDVYGLTNRAKYICDQFASRGNFHVIMPDCFRGVTWENNEDLFSWLPKYTFSDVVAKDVKACMDELQSSSSSTTTPADKDDNKESKNSDEKDTTQSASKKDDDDDDDGISFMAAIGFCWGGWAVTKLAASLNKAPTANKTDDTTEKKDGDDDDDDDDRPFPLKLNCGVGLHPSTKLEKMLFQSDEDAMLRTATESVPLMLLTASNDPDNIKPGGDLATLVEKSNGQCMEFPDMVHGWVTRGDLTKEDVKRDAEKALTMTLEFLERFAS